MAIRQMRIPIQGLEDAGKVIPLEEALRQQEGVIWARVNFAAQEVIVLYDPASFRLSRILQMVRSQGYEVALPQWPADSQALRTRLQALGIPVGAGLAGAALLVGLYLSLVTLAQGWGHALELLWEDRWLVGAIAAGFGIQVGLYVYLRRLRACPVNPHAATAMTAAGTGTSSLAMVGCCAHHVTDALPLLGLTAAATLLNQYRIPFMVVGIGMNGVGILWMGRALLRIRQRMGPRMDPRRSG
ncbi:hypothetical protein HRbin22_00075 [Candidatus Thermoflexus japonica]|uniref:HMA domain-containing protein n=1 Tax=Candidatus Thermoflexus japonica TaxID=2035417 RepID=A0A2H5Y326_9CHLR|nr:hypothetical protein HRbin22_00075 [Candidatus Thermoflexus japonica]